MKKTLYAIILITLSFSMFGQDNSVFGRNNINSAHVLYKKNRVKSIKGLWYKNEKTKGRGKLLTYALYDTMGMLMEEFSYYSDEYHKKYKYDAKGNLSKDIGYVLNSPVETTFSYKYDDQGRIVEKEVGNAPLFTDIFYYKYDSIGNVCKIKWLMGADKQPNFYFTDTFEYNINNKLVKMTRIRPDASIYFYKFYQYDNTGNLVEEIRFEKKNPTDVWEYRYDSNNNCIEEEWFDKIGTGHSSSKANYNDKGLAVSRHGYKGYIKYIYEYYN